MGSCALEGSFPYRRILSHSPSVFLNVMATACLCTGGLTCSRRHLYQHCVLKLGGYLKIVFHCSFDFCFYRAVCRMSRALYTVEITPLSLVLHILSGCHWSWFLFHAENLLFGVSNTVTYQRFLLWLLGFRTQVAKGLFLGRAPQASPARQQRQFPQPCPGILELIFADRKADSVSPCFTFWFCEAVKLCWLKCTSTLCFAYVSTSEKSLLEDVDPSVLQNRFRLVVCLPSLFLFWAQLTHDVSLVSGCSLPFKGTCWILPMVLSFVIKSVTVVVSYFDVRLLPTGF